MAYRTVKSGEGLSSFLVVNGVEFPCPRVGFSYIISTTVNAGRNANNAVIGQKIGRDLYKLNNLEWAMLDAETWKNMLAAIEPFYVPVTFEDYDKTFESISENDLRNTFFTSQDECQEFCDYLNEKRGVAGYIYNLKGQLISKKER